ncbi:MAG: phosphodiester glycosidase family protein [Gemmatimonadaceae bacterium]|nr:phosphodiester glycosidase family protein [Chitinophagaceae bacterium]
MMKIFSRIAMLFAFMLMSAISVAQLRWQNVDSLYAPLPASVHVYKSTDSVGGKPNVAFYVEADLNDRALVFNTDTTFRRRLTPTGFYEKNSQPLVVVNTTFFSFQTNQNLNTVIRNGRQLGYNIHTVNGRGKDTFTYKHPFTGAIGISKRRKADVAWVFSDSTSRRAYAFQMPVEAYKDSSVKLSRKKAGSLYGKNVPELRKWKMNTAVGGGPVLVQNGNTSISNNEEMKFAGKAVSDRHPRTAMGYTQNGKLIILVIQGRMPGVAEGADLTQEAVILKDLGCTEALNLDGGGSSCLLVNGKETIKVSDKEGQRPVPAVFIIARK